MKHIRYTDNTNHTMSFQTEVYLEEIDAYVEVEAIIPLGFDEPEVIELIPVEDYEYPEDVSLMEMEIALENYVITNQIELLRTFDALCKEQDNDNKIIAAGY